MHILCIITFWNYDNVTFFKWKRSKCAISIQGDAYEYTFNGLFDMHILDNSWERSWKWIVFYSPCSTHCELNYSIFYASNRFLEKKTVNRHYYPGCS